MAEVAVSMGVWTGCPNCGRVHSGRSAAHDPSCLAYEDTRHRFERWGRIDFWLRATPAVPPPRRPGVCEVDETLLAPGFEAPGLSP